MRALFRSSLRGPETNDILFGLNGMLVPEMRIKYRKFGWPIEKSTGQDFKTEKRRKSGKKRRGRKRRGSSSSDSSSDDEREGDRLEEQALLARHQGQPMQRPLGPSWKPEYNHAQFCMPTWNNSIGSPMQEHQLQREQWQYAGAAMDQGRGHQQDSFQGNCNICGVKGHKARNCKAQCPHCGRTGHAPQNCFELEVNAHRRPQWWKPRAQGTGNAGEVTVQASNGGGAPQEVVVQRACGICQSPAHVDADCPMTKLRELQQRMNERGHHQD